MEVADLHKKDGCAEVVNVCHLSFPESGENLPIIMMTAISAYGHFQVQKDKGQEKDCLFNYFFFYYPCQPCPELPIPQPPTTRAISSTSSEDDDADFEVDTQCSCKDPHFPNQNELDGLTRDLGLSKAKAVILSSRFKSELYFFSLSNKLAILKKSRVLLS